tara:strand:- start:520 stop:807 length:288 start_codon:yes stop_codon:yes gene_type:complete
MIKCFILNQTTDQQQNDTKSKLNQAKIDVEICKFIQHIQQGDKSENDKFSDLNLGETNNFFGLFKDETLEEKKTQVLMIYKLIFRFSIEKLTDYL